MTAPHDNPTPSTERNITRRTIVKGAAWSVPVIAAAAAVPMAAASATGCISDADATFSFTSAPVTAPYATTTTSGKPLYQYKQGQSYEMTTTMTITYNGTLPAPISGLSFTVGGTNWFEWTLTGTPTVSSSRGNMTLGSFSEWPVANVPTDSRGMTTITPIAVGTDATVHPGDVITVSWNFIAHGPTEPIGAAGSGYAYTFGSLTSCGGTTAYHPDASSAPALYTYVL